MASLLTRLRRLRHEVLGLNRRNADFLLRLNPAPLVALVDNKVRTKAVLAQHGLPVPATFGVYRTNGQLGALLAEAERRQEFVLKPARGAGGEGIVVVAGRRSERFMTVSGGTLSRADFLARAADIVAGAFALSQTRDEAVLEERLVTDRTLAAFAPGGVADVRVVVLFGVPVMAMARLPTRHSAGRANLHVGGIGVGLDLATGHGTHAIMHGRPIGVHPDTGQALAALQVPGWATILEIAAGSYDAIRLGYCGIDVVVDARRGPVVLEINARPGLAIQLATRHGLRPLLAAVQARRNEAAAVADRVALGVKLAATPGADGSPEGRA